MGTKGSKKKRVIEAVLVHNWKTFATCLLLMSSLIRMSPQLLGVQVFSTDGCMSLPTFSHMILDFASTDMCHPCSMQELRHKLADCNSPSKLSNKMLDIFSREQGSVLVEGIVDAYGVADFQKKLDYLQVWEALVSTVQLIWRAYWVAFLKDSWCNMRYYAAPCQGGIWFGMPSRHIHNQRQWDHQCCSQILGQLQVI